MLLGELPIGYYTNEEFMHSVTQLAQHEVDTFRKLVQQFESQIIIEDEVTSLPHNFIVFIDVPALNPAKVMMHYRVSQVRSFEHDQVCIKFEWYEARQFAVGDQPSVKNLAEIKPYMGDILLEYPGTSVIPLMTHWQMNLCQRIWLKKVQQGNTTADKLLQVFDDLLKNKQDLYYQCLTGVTPASNKDADTICSDGKFEAIINSL